MTPTEFAIIMVVHNAREIVQLSTQRTLRHIAGQNARLIVVDNASGDGVEEWLGMLARRRAMLQDNVMAAGILHPRGYVHPSCLIIEREIIAKLNLSFLKNRNE